MARRAIGAWLRTRGLGELFPTPPFRCSPSFRHAFGEPAALSTACAPNPTKGARAPLLAAAAADPCGLPRRCRAPCLCASFRASSAATSTAASAAASSLVPSCSSSSSSASGRQRDQQRKHELLQQQGDLQVEPLEAEDDDHRGGDTPALSLPSTPVDVDDGGGGGGGNSSGVGNSGGSSVGTNSSGDAGTVDSSSGGLTHRRRDMAIAYTCGKCGARAVKAFTRAAYEQGVVIVQCSGCSARHLIADNLGWFPREGEEGGGEEGGRGGGGEERGAAGLSKDGARGGGGGGGDGGARAAAPGGRRLVAGRGLGGRGPRRRAAHDSGRGGQGGGGFGGGSGSSGSSGSSSGGRGRGSRGSGGGCVEIWRRLTG